MAKKLEDSNNVNKTEASIQTMIGPYRKWAGAQRRNGNTDNYNKGSGKGAPANNNNYNNDGGGGGKGASAGKNNNDDNNHDNGNGHGAATGGDYYNTKCNNNNNKDSGTEFTVKGKGKAKGKGAGYVPYPASKGKSKGKGKGDLLDGTAFEDGHIPMIDAFSDGNGKPLAQIHTDQSSMDMDNNVFLGDIPTTFWRGMNNRSVGPSAAIVRGTLLAMIAHDAKGELRARLRPKEIELPLSKDNKTQPKNATCLLCQLGDEDIHYTPKISNIAPPTAKYASLSTRIYKKIAPTLFPQVTTPKGYEEHIRSFLGKELLYSNVTPVKTMHKHDLQWKDEPQEAQLGWSHVQTDKLEEAIMRSGRNAPSFTET